MDKRPKEMNKRKPTNCIILVMISVAVSVGMYFATPAISETKDPVTLNFWHTYSLAEIKVLNEQVDRYMKENPNIKIKLTNIPFKQRATMIIAAIKGGAPPDLYRGDMPMQFEIARLNAAYPLEDYLKTNNPELLTDVPDNVWEMCKYNGHIIAIPEDFFVPVIYYNKDLFIKSGIGEFPTNWGELFEAAKKLHRPSEGISGIEWMPWGDGPYWSMGALFLSNGGGILKRNGTVVLDSKNNIETFEFIKKLYNYTPIGMSTFSYDDWDKAFYLGRVGIQLGNGSWSIGNYRELAPKLNYGIASYIKGPSGTEVRVPGHGVCFYMVMNKTKYPKLAASILVWLVNSENHLEWNKKLMHTPVRKSTFENPFFDDPKFDAFKFELTHAYSEFTGDMATIFAPLINNIFRETFWNIVEGNVPTEDALRSATTKMKKVIRELGEK